MKLESCSHLFWKYYKNCVENDDENLACIQDWGNSCDVWIEIDVICIWWKWTLSTINDGALNKFSFQYVLKHTEFFGGKSEYVQICVANTSSLTIASQNFPLIL